MKDRAEHLDGAVLPPEHDVLDLGVGRVRGEHQRASRGVPPTHEGAVVLGLHDDDGTVRRLGDVRVIDGAGPLRYGAHPR